MLTKDKVFVMTLSFNGFPMTAFVIQRILELYDRNKIVLCVCDNASTDFQKEWHQKHQGDYDIFIQNPFNSGTIFALNDMIRAFKESGCEFMIYHEGDTAPASPFPAHVLTKAWKEHYRHMKPTPIFFGFKFDKSNTWPPIQNKWSPEFIKLPDSREDTVDGSLPLWPSVAAHRRVWDLLGYFDESDLHGDVEMRPRFKFGIMNLGEYTWTVAPILQALAGANHYAHHPKYYSEGRFVFGKAGTNSYIWTRQAHNINLHIRAKNGDIYRPSLADPNDPKWVCNPYILGDQTYKDIAIKNLEYMKVKGQPDFGGGPAWIPRNDVRWSKFEKFLLARLRYIGEDVLADDVENGRI